MWEAAQAALRGVVKFLAPASPEVGAGSVRVHHDYGVESSMSAVAAFPWVWVCVQAISTDLSALPLRAVRVLPDGSREPVADPALALLESPNASMGGTLFRKQWVAYQSVARNAYIWRPGGPAIYLLHPENVTPLANTMGLTTAYEVRNPETGDITTVPASEIIHTRDISWQSGRAGLVGESAIRPMHADLTMEKGAKKLAAQQAQRGRPDIMFSSTDSLGQNLIDTILGRWNKCATENHGAFFSGANIKADMLGWTPRDMEFAENSLRTRDTILAMFGVVPVRAGISSANHGTSRQQMRTYWEGLKTFARLLDDALSQLAAPGVRIEHDFTDVEALQVSYTERLKRVSDWVGMGASPKAAAVFEGFVAPPVPDKPIVDRFHSPRNPKQEVQEPQKVLAGYLQSAAIRWTSTAERVDADTDLTLLANVERQLLCVDLVNAGVPSTVADSMARRISGLHRERVGAAIARTEDVATLSLWSGDSAAKWAAQLNHRMAA